MKSETQWTANVIVQNSHHMRGSSISKLAGVSESTGHFTIDQQESQIPIIQKYQVNLLSLW